jgi:DNA adenine methylase
METIKGKFLLSSFRNARLAEFTLKNCWHTVEVRISSSMTHVRGRTVRDKVDALTANYPISVKLEEWSKKRLASGEEAGD